MKTKSCAMKQAWFTQPPRLTLHHAQIQSGHIGLNKQFAALPISPPPRHDSTSPKIPTPRQVG